MLVNEGHLMKDYFEILQINDDADNSTIKKAYQDMLIKFPADRYPKENSDIVKAYQVLQDHSMADACLNFHRMQSTSKQVYKLAEQEMEEGCYDGTIKILDKTIKAEEFNDHLYYLLGIACLGAEKYTKAVKAFDKIISKYPYDHNLLLHYTEACIANENYKKAVISAKKGYERDKDNTLFALYLVKAYIQTGKNKEAETDLKEAMNNPAFKVKRHIICARLAFVLSLERKFNESLEYMEKLLTFDAGNDEKIESGEMLLNTLDYYLEYQMYKEANSCMGVIIRLLPDREDIVNAKKRITKILDLEKEFCSFEEDDSVPEGLLGIIINELFPEASTDLTERQREAYAVMNEYQILHDYNMYLMPLRYIKTKYPGLYELKKNFFEELEDLKKRKILKAKYQTLIYQYQDTFEEMMDAWEEEEDFEDDKNEDKKGKGDVSRKGDTSQLIVNQKEPVKELSNIRPFIRREDRVGRNDPCPCGSGKKYRNCCAKD